MRKLSLRLIIIMYVPLALLAACDVHEWPDAPEEAAFRLRLSYETGMAVWEHLYDGAEVAEQGLGETYDNARGHGQMRYVIRAYPAGSTQECAKEYTFTQDLSEGYGYEAELSLAPGDYSIMAWSDLVEDGGDEPYYDAADFSGITLQGEHAGSDDYRDAFRGTCGVSLPASVTEQAPDTFEITMQRPMGKFEAVTADLEEFLEKESSRAAAKAGAGDYTAVFYYAGFMPDTYSMFTDKPVDSATGVMFQSSLEELGGGEASLGFDYVFVDGGGSSVAVQIGIYDGGGALVSLTGTIEVPLARSRHTVLRGRFLTAEASGGAAIDPGYGGEYNLFFP